MSNKLDQLKTNLLMWGLRFTPLNFQKKDEVKYGFKALLMILFLGRYVSYN